MDIGVDQGLPRGDLKKENDGKYIFRDPVTKKFDVDRFNLNFEEYEKRRKAEMKKKMDEKLDKLNTPVKRTPIYGESIGKIILGTKDALFNILDDILQYKFTNETLTKNNRLFYIGLTLIFIALFIYFYHILISGENTISKKEVIVRHVYDMKNGVMTTV